MSKENKIRETAREVWLCIVSDSPPYGERSLGERWDAADAIVEAALAEARLEGARLMQEKGKAAAYMATCNDTNATQKRVSQALAALDPQQVINESMGK